MTVITERNYLDDGVYFEEDNLYSRNEIVIESGQNLAALSVVGKKTKRQAAAPIPAVVGTGDGVMSGLVMGPLAEVGTYVIKCVAIAAHGGTFSVTTPSGKALANMVLTPGAGLSTVYKSGHLDFVITDGAADFVLNDTFSVVVTAAGVPVVVGTGNGAVSAVSIGRQAVNGSYMAVCKEAVVTGGVFSVVGPDGSALADFELTPATPTPYVSEQVNFTVTPGGVDFIVGDYFMIVVAAGTGQAVIVNLGAVDGSQIAAGITIAPYDATLAAVKGVIIVRNAIVSRAALGFPSGLSVGEKDAIMATLAGAGIVEREAA
jgi:hypothetical protein